MARVSSLCFFDTQGSSHPGMLGGMGEEGRMGGRVARRDGLVATMKSLNPAKRVGQFLVAVRVALCLCLVMYVVEHETLFFCFRFVTTMSSFHPFVLSRFASPPPPPLPSVPSGSIYKGISASVSLGISRLGAKRAVTLSRTMRATQHAEMMTRSVRRLFGCVWGEGRGGCEGRGV